MVKLTFTDGQEVKIQSTQYSPFIVFPNKQNAGN